ncbi:hypothetical protein TWF281_004319 [Arthrobotrys megalospora]
MYFLKTATVFILSLQTALITAQSASLVRSYIKSERKVAENISPLVETLNYHLEVEEWMPVFRKVIAGTNALTRGLKLAERRFGEKLPVFDAVDATEIEADFLSFADEAVNVLATFTRKTRPAAAAQEEISKLALQPFTNLENALKTYIKKLLKTIPSASDALYISTQLIQDEVGGLVLIFEESVGTGPSIVVDGSHAGKIKIIIK